MIILLKWSIFLFKICQKKYDNVEKNYSISKENVFFKSCRPDASQFKSGFKNSLRLPVPKKKTIFINTGHAFYSLTVTYEESDLQLQFVDSSLKCLLKWLVKDKSTGITVVLCGDLVLLNQNRDTNTFDEK